MNKKIFIGILALTISVCTFVGCGPKEPTRVNDSTISEEQQESVDLNTYNNGGLYVQYKGNTYYREYSNADVEEGTVGASYMYRTDVKTSKYINAISSDGRVRNIFEDDGYGEFYILDDRFFFKGYNNKLYSVTLIGDEYREFGKGTYVGFDEESHKIYYKNLSNNNALYSLDTKNLKITKLSNEDLNINLINNDSIFYSEFVGKNSIKISKLERDKISEICTISVQGDLSENTYYIEDMEKYEDKLLLSMGYNAGTINTYSDSGLYVIDLKNNEYQLLDKNVSRELKLDKNILYYTVINDVETYEEVVKKIDLSSMKIENTNLIGKIRNNMILADGEGLAYFDNSLNKKEVVSTEDLRVFKEKYNISNDDEKYFAQVSNVEVAGDRIYYLIELSRVNEEYSIGWREGYERIVTEAYMYNMDTNKNTLLYLYKASDKDNIESGDIYDENYEEPLAENEMYLEIKLADKGLKETFDIRVEEVGGLIIGKRIEYEGTHSRSEGTLKIKVTKEIGAMLTVYIDNKIDSQMLIEE